MYFSLVIRSICRFSLPNFCAVLILDKNKCLNFMSCSTYYTYISIYLSPNRLIISDSNEWEQYSVYTF